MKPQQGRATAICVSPRKGTAKVPVKRAMLVENYGIEGDAHAGSEIRQVSLMPYEKIQTFRREKYTVTDGAFGENLIVKGIDFAGIAIGMQVSIGEAVLEVSQIGKECHNGCAIKQAVGYCIMPTEGIFFKVIRGGEITVGDRVRIGGSNEESI